MNRAETLMEATCGYSTVPDKIVLTEADILNAHTAMHVQGEGLFTEDFCQLMGTRDHVKLTALKAKFEEVALAYFDTSLEDLDREDKTVSFFMHKVLEGLRQGKQIPE